MTLDPDRAALVLAWLLAIGSGLLVVGSALDGAYFHTAFFVLATCMAIGFVRMSRKGRSNDP